MSYNLYSDCCLRQLPPNTDICPQCQEHCTPIRLTEMEFSDRVEVEEEEDDDEVLGDVVKIVK